MSCFYIKGGDKYKLSCCTTVPPLLRYLRQGCYDKSMTENTVHEKFSSVFSQQFVCHQDCSISYGLNFLKYRQ